MKIIKLLTIILSLNSFAGEIDLNSVDQEALAQARANAKNLTAQMIFEIINHESLQVCMHDVFEQAKHFDRRRKLEEVALWVYKDINGLYACQFWPESSRVRGGFDWDGTLPKNTLFSLHSHPETSGGPRPSESDYKFNKSLGVIGLIFAYHHKKISIHFPGQKSYNILFNTKNFIKLKNKLGL